MSTPKYMASRPKNGYVLPPEKLAQRQKAFGIYRDMGAVRSYSLLERELKQHHSGSSLCRGPGSRAGHVSIQWVERCKAHDDALKSSLVLKTPDLGADFDQVDKLLSAAHLALTKAIAGTPVVTKPSDLKALVDASANAIKLAESIRAKRGDNTSCETIVREISRILDQVEARVGARMLSTRCAPTAGPRLLCASSA